MELCGFIKNGGIYSIIKSRIGKTCSIRKSRAK